MTEQQRPWQDHEPMLAKREGQVIALGCLACGWRSSEQSWSAAGFAEHLKALGTPGYMIHYWDRWAEYVELPFWGIDRDAVARELSDYTVVMDNASLVYSELADLSKPNTAPQYILQGAEDRYAATYADFLCDAADGYAQDGAADIAQAMIELAETWHEGAWEEYKAGRDRAAELGLRKPSQKN